MDICDSAVSVRKTWIHVAVLSVRKTWIYVTVL